MKYLTDTIKQKIVNGILDGEKKYIEERVRAQKEFKISGAYAWVRGNVIDSLVFDALKDEDSGVRLNVAKAGYSWDYLQLKINDETLIIIKNVMSMDRISGNIKKISKDNYLNKFAEINDDYFKNNSKKLFHQTELALEEIKEPIDSVENISKLKTFYIVTYELDENGMVSAIKLTMPRKNDLMLEEIEDLSKLMDNHIIEYNDEELKMANKETPAIPEGQFSTVKYTVKNNEENKTNN